MNKIKMEGLSWVEVTEMKMKIMIMINNNNQKGKRKRKIIAVDS